MAIKLRIGQRVEGGETTEDYDVGRVAEIDGDRVSVAWDSGVETSQHAGLLRPVETRIPAEGDRDDGLVCGSQVRVDRSGVGHAWTDIDARDIPAAVREEIEGEMIDGSRDECDGFVASNGLRYRW